MFSFTVISRARVLRGENAPYPMLGMKVGPNAGVALAVAFDVFWPGKTTLGDNCVLGYNVTVLAHEFLVDEGWVRPPSETRP